LPSFPRRRKCFSTAEGLVNPWTFVSTANVHGSPRDSRCSLAGRAGFAVVSLRSARGDDAHERVVQAFPKASVGIPRGSFPRPPPGGRGILGPAPHTDAPDVDTAMAWPQA